jgi:hypothetical protein
VVRVADGKATVVPPHLTDGSLADACRGSHRDGKTTAVRAWSARLDVGLAWVRLDADDSDPVLLWRYVATAVDRVRAGLGGGALRKLDAAGNPVEAAADELMNEVARWGASWSLGWKTCTR